jgi:hypothetical protein
MNGGEGSAGGRHGLPLLLLIGALAFPGVGRAGTYDPSLHWLTIDTEHFRIHFHDGLAPLARKTARVAEEILHRLRPSLGYMPQYRINVVLSDSSDFSNGYANVLAHNTVVLYTVSPTADSVLDNHEDWLWAVLVHELAHILQIDAHSGIWTVFRWVVGRIAAPGSLQPGWATEGFAVYQETIQTGAGRGRSATTQQVLRTLALSGRFPHLGRAEGFQRDWPSGSVRYLLGGRFHLWIAREHGPEAWDRYHRLHSRRLLPFFLPAKAAFGETFHRMWGRWRSEVEDEANQWALEQSRRGLTGSHRLGRDHLRYSELATSPQDGRVVGLRSAEDRPSALFLWEPDLRRGRRLLGRRGVRGTSWHPDARSFVFGGSRSQRYATTMRLRLYDLPTRTERQLSGKRLRDPSFHPDGDRLVAVLSERGQSYLALVELPRHPGSRPDEDRRTYRARLRREAREARRLDRDGAEVPWRPKVEVWEHPLDHREYSRPVWSPDGQRIAVSEWREGGERRIRLYDATGQELGALPDAVGSDAEPVFSPDGGHLLFASDRDGAWNLYAHRFDDGSTLRVSRNLGGARWPRIQLDEAGRPLAILFTTQGGEGPEVHRMAWDPEGWTPWDGDTRGREAIDQLWPQAAESPPRAARAVSEDPDGIAGVERGELRDESLRAARERARLVLDREHLGRGPYPPRPYAPLRSLLVPRALYPGGAFTDRGLLLQLGTGGSDILGWMSWSGGLSLNTESLFLGGWFGFSVLKWASQFGVSYSAISVDWGPAWLLSDADGGEFPGSYRGDTTVFQRRDRVLAWATVPWGLKNRFSFRYTLDLRRLVREGALLDELGDRLDRSRLPSSGNFGGLRLDWTFSDLRSSNRAISPEQGFSSSVSAQLSSRILGSYFERPDGERGSLEQLLLTAETRGYVPMPWRRNHVLALRLGGGTTLPLVPGTAVSQSNFRMGGYFGDSAYISLADTYLPLRGYRLSFLRGNHMLGASAEYRFPLFRADTGLSTLPIFLRSVGGSIFYDVGQAWDEADSPAAWAAQLRSSVGIELTGEVLLWWGGYLKLRAGTALGLSTGALPIGVPASYVILGSSF